MHFNLFFLPALIAAASAQPTESSKTNDIFARDEYRWCLGTMSPFLPYQPKYQLTNFTGEKINSGTLRKCKPLISSF